MPNRIFIDTLFLIALINPRDQYHARATELAARYEDHPFLVTDAVLLEIGNGLALNYKQEAILGRLGAVIGDLTNLGVTRSRPSPLNRCCFLECGVDEVLAFAQPVCAGS